VRVKHMTYRYPFSFPFPLPWVKMHNTRKMKETNGVDARGRRVTRRAWQRVVSRIGQLGLRWNSGPSFLAEATCCRTRVGT